VKPILSQFISIRLKYCLRVGSRNGGNYARVVFLFANSRSIRRACNDLSRNKHRARSALELRAGRLQWQLYCIHECLQRGYHRYVDRRQWQERNRGDSPRHLRNCFYKRPIQLHSGILAVGNGADHSGCDGECRQSNRLIWTSKPTNSDCRRIPVFDKTDLSCVRIVSRDSPFAIATSSMVLPSTNPWAVRASAGLKSKSPLRSSEDGARGDAKGVTTSKKVAPEKISRACRLIGTR
jgi:hypothetical protein